MHDFEAYQAALDERGRDEHGEASYSNSLMGSMCLVLEEFYNNLRVNLTFSSFTSRLLILLVYRR